MGVCCDCHNERCKKWAREHKDEARKINKKSAAKFKQEHGVTRQTVHRRAYKKERSEYRITSLNKSKPTLMGTLGILLGNAKITIWRRNLIDKPMSIDRLYLIELWEKQEGRCAITGDQMQLASSGKHNPMKVSMDQIIPRGGYVRGNVQLVCMYANYMKRNLPMEKFVDACRKVAARFPKGD